MDVGCGSGARSIRGAVSGVPAGDGEADGRVFAVDGEELEPILETGPTGVGMDDVASERGTAFNVGTGAGSASTPSAGAGAGDGIWAGGGIGMEMPPFEGGIGILTL